MEIEELIKKKHELIREIDRLEILINNENSKKMQNDIKNLDKIKAKGETKLTYKIKLDQENKRIRKEIENIIKIKKQMRDNKKSNTKEYKGYINKYRELMKELENNIKEKKGVLND